MYNILVDTYDNDGKFDCVAWLSLMTTEIAMDDDDDDGNNDGDYNKW